MIRQLRYLSLFAGALALASVAHAQTYQMELTGVAPDGASADGVYVSPYQGTIVQGGTISGGSIVGGTTVFTGYVICDDFNTESTLNSPWNATVSNAAAGSGKFAGETYTLGGKTYNSTQMYNAVAYLASQLELSANLNSATAQTNYSFAIWDIMDGSGSGGGSATDPDGGAAALIAAAFAQVLNGYVGSSVDVFTAVPAGASQEFLVIGGPDPPPPSAPEPAAVGILGVNLVTALGLILVRRRRGAQAA